jgi:predicted acyl esterase
MSGTATARVRLTFTGVANVTALLVDRAPDGTATIVTRAWTDPRNRVSEWFSQPVLPGMPYDLKLTFMPRDYTLAAGHTLGLSCCRATMKRRCGRRPARALRSIRQARRSRCRWYRRERSGARVSG